ncbi:ATP-binding cassette domain-containing protein [Glaesserella parasuis]|nr:ATP-binding cassette domain-containing protein [Glaesserella parasuis]MCT8742891.1 ATP-binding cassette domain-containing protein [Glaesserella parasuis]MCT8744605.1 ATP-binding cassette domain-containing protein [Glaesserella parasuis]MCT8765703.1 ATP-binding cassette domain-containing protein [Glaesserella parasuis]MCT8769645.1 ATP-binding cassette domain-containing protein [Glaesserella parasuis]
MIFFTDLTLKRGQTILLEQANATIHTGQKVGLIGKNGCGKSSLFALLKNELQAEGGDASYPKNWSIAWVNQETPALDISALDYVIQGDREYTQLTAQLEQANLENNGNLIATLHAQLDTIDAWTIQSRASTLLNGLGFSTEQLQLPVKSFSGGWRMRLNLAQALICRSDLLLLDEPTNHLDLDAVIWLERWLSNYRGTLLLISHDCHLLRSTVNEFYLVHDGKVEEFNGNLEDYQKWLNELNAQLEFAKKADNPTACHNENSAVNRKEQKRQEAELRQQAAPLRKKLTQLEKELEKLTASLTTLEETLASPEIYDVENKAKLTDTLAKRVATKKQLEEVEMEWLEVQEQLEVLMNG